MTLKEAVEAAAVAESNLETVLAELQIADNQRGPGSRRTNAYAIGIASAARNKAKMLADTLANRLAAQGDKPLERS